ncbi:MAG: hypothetical protein HZB65_03490 [Candidatus Aenigmarchaeota archaeon]|nr:hypothetical protein [Candidatus Aenigmarchaeota archaeon]
MDLGTQDEYKETVALLGDTGSKSSYTRGFLRGNVPDVEWEITRTVCGHSVARKDMFDRVICFEEFSDRIGLAKYLDSLLGKGSYSKAFDFMSERAGKLVSVYTTIESKIWHEYAPNRYSEHTDFPVIIPHNGKYAVFINGEGTTLSTKRAVAEFLYDKDCQNFECLRMTGTEKKTFSRDVKGMMRCIRLQNDSISTLTTSFDPLNEYTFSG